MKKLVVLPNKQSVYSSLIHKIKNLNLQNTIFISETSLDISFLKKFDVIIFKELKKDLLKKANELKIVLIKINKFKNFNHLIDVSIDPFFDLKKKNIINPIKGNFSPIQLDTSNIQEFKFILNIVTIMDWDSKFWKKKICFIGLKRLTNNIMYRINKFVKKNKIEMIQFLSHCHDSKTVKIAERNKFGFKDIRITLEKKIDFKNKNINKNQNLTFRKAKLSDFNNIKPIAKNSYLESRYYFDDYFSTKKVKDFYIGWLKKSILGIFDDFCLLICLRKKPIGFCTIKVNQDEASIGLLSISSKYQRRGFSKILLSAIDYEMKKINIKNLSVVTQGRNYSALRAYQNSNFKISKTELWYHKWII